MRFTRPLLFVLCAGVSPLSARPSGDGGDAGPPARGRHSVRNETIAPAVSSRFVLHGEITGAADAPVRAARFALAGAVAKGAATCEGDAGGAIFGDGFED
jgi:hypothetical protein